MRRGICVYSALSVLIERFVHNDVVAELPGFASSSVSGGVPPPFLGGGLGGRSPPPEQKELLLAAHESCLERRVQDQLLGAPSRGSIELFRVERVLCRVLCRPCRY